MARIRYSTAAIKDLEQIGDYIAATLQNPMAALNTVTMIQDAIDKLADFPLIGSQLPLAPEMDRDYRFLVCGNYLAFYRTKDCTVFIVRILYGKRDYLRILLGDLPE